MAISRKFFATAAEMILEGGFKKVSKIFSEKEVVTATCRSRTRSRGKNYHTEIIFTIGRPNYQARERIRKAKLLRLSFPLAVNFGEPLRKARS